MKRIGLLASLCFCAAFAVHAQLDGVTASIKLGQDEYLPGEDMEVKVQIINRSGQQVTFGTDNDWIELSIWGDHNISPPRLGDMPLKGEFTLTSGEMATRIVNPAPYYDLTRPGRYHISAKIHVRQWNQEISCKGISFTIANGVPLPNLANLQIGVPPAPGVTNVAPEVRRFSLLEVSHLNDLKLYFRLTDATGRVLRLFSIGKMISFSSPEAQIDRYNNFHILYQTGARSFNYSVVNPDGMLVLRRTYMYTGSRPELHPGPEGEVFVGGGMRRLAADDLPPPETGKAQ